MLITNLLLCVVSGCSQVISKGVPDDAMQGISGRQVPLPDSLLNFQYMYNSTGSKVRGGCSGVLCYCSYSCIVWARSNAQQHPEQGNDEDEPCVVLCRAVLLPAQCRCSVCKTDGSHLGSLGCTALPCCAVLSYTSCD